MDIYFTLKSIAKSGINNKIYSCMDEPICIIDNLFYCNIYNINNYSILRDYNFKNVIYLTDQNMSKIEEINKFEEKDIKYHTITFNSEIIDFKDIEKIIDLINRLQLYEDYASNQSLNICIYSHSSDKLYLILIALLIIKYNFTIKKSIRKLEKIFSLEKNKLKLDEKLLNILKEFI